MTTVAKKHTATKKHPFHGHHKAEMTFSENMASDVPTLDLDLARKALSTISADEIKVLQHAGIKVSDDVESARKTFATYTQAEVQDLYTKGGAAVMTCPEELLSASDALGMRLNSCMNEGKGEAGGDADLEALLESFLAGGAGGPSDDSEIGADQDRL